MQTKKRTIIVKNEYIEFVLVATRRVEQSWYEGQTHAGQIFLCADTKVQVEQSVLWVLSFGRFGFLRVKEQSLPGGSGHILMWNVATVLKIIIAVALSSSSCTVCSANQQWDTKIATKMSLASRLLAHRLVVAFERASRRLGKPSLLLSRWAHGCKDNETV